jgi:outer membrane protein
MSRPGQGLVGALVLGAMIAPGSARAEDLNEAWAIALQVNSRLLAQQDESQAAASTVGAARSARLPSVKNQTYNVLLTPSPAFSAPGAGTASGAGGGGTGAAGAGVAILGPAQVDIPLSNTAVVVPLYSGGRLKHNVQAAVAQLGVQRAEEFRTALDLKLTVAEAYVGVLLAEKSLAVTESNVARLSAFLQDVQNRKSVGLATLNDSLSAEVSLSNAQHDQITAQKNLSAAWAKYNRYLCRPLTFTTKLSDMSVPPASGDLDDLTTMALRSRPELATASEAEIQAITADAMQARPELAGLTEQARSLAAQAEAARAGTRPSVTLNGGYTYIGLNGLSHTSFLTSLVSVNWTLCDAGATRRRTESLRGQERAALHRRADTAADIALEVRSQWLDLAEARRRIPVTRQAIAQAEENVKVVLDRYREGLSTYTQVLDAESLRVQTFTNYYAAVYDSVLAAYRLKRAVGSL